MVRGSGRTLDCTFAVAGLTARATVVQAQIRIEPTQALQTEVFVPQTENWVFTDMYILVAADAGVSQPEISFIKNRTNTMGTTAPLGVFLVTSNTRPRFLPSPIGFEAGSIIGIQGTTTVVAGAGADAIQFFVAVDIQ